MIPVVLYSVLYNLPKFFELTLACPADLENNKTSADSKFTNTSSTTNTLQPVPANLSGLLSLGGPHPGQDSCRYWELQLVAREIRTSYWYLTIYVLWLNTILNIIVPILTLIVLNIIILRKIKQHMQNLEESCQVELSARPSVTRLRQEKLIRKREVVISRVSVYIVVIIVSCHTIRIVPNMWEIAQTFNREDGGKAFYWPPWVDLVTAISHLALTTSCSISFYIYYAKYGANKKDITTRWQSFSNFWKSRRATRDPRDTQSNSCFEMENCAGIARDGATMQSYMASWES